MPETRITYVVQRLRLKKNGEAHARGWEDYHPPTDDEAAVTQVFTWHQENARRLAMTGAVAPLYRLVKIEERREVIA